MSEILFIAVDTSILALVENLQQLVEPRICVESDYTSGIKRIFDRHPAIVFLQHKIGQVSCDKLANQVKMLLDAEAVPLVLLSEESILSYSVVSTYEACFDLCLPLGELSRQVQLLLRRIPGIEWKESAAPAQPVEEYPPQTTMEISLPAAADFPMPFPWQEEAPSSYPALGGATLEAFEANAATPAEPAPALEPEPQFLADFLEDRFVIAPLPLMFDGSLHQEEAPQEFAGQPEDPLHALQLLDESEPHPVFENEPAPPAEPSFSAPKPIGPRPAGKDAAPQSAPVELAWADSQVPRRAEPARAESSLPPPRTAPQPSAAGGSEAPQPVPATHDLPESVATALGIKKEHPWYFRGAALGLLLVTGIASLDLFYTLHPRSGGSEPSQGIGQPENSLQAQGAAPLPAAQQLSQIIPQVAPDQSYPVRHPGWERYQADALEYLVYRDKGGVKAVQVLGQQPGAITRPFLTACLRVSSGQEQYVVKKTEERSGIRITDGALANGGEVVIYQAVSDGEIRGFVISTPAGGQASAQQAQK